MVFHVAEWPGAGVHRRHDHAGVQPQVSFIKKICMTFYCIWTCFENASNFKNASLINFPVGIQYIFHSSRNTVHQQACPEAEFLEEIQTKVLRVFLLAIHSHFYSFALRFLFLQIHATSYSFYSLVTVHCEGERRKTWEKTLPPSLSLKKSIQKPQVWEIWRLGPETSTKLYIHEFGFRNLDCTITIFDYYCTYEW